MYNKILSKYINNELRIDFADYDLSGINKLMELLGNPHSKFKSVHIAGTNGKGTTSSLIASVLTSGGYKTALYTSPHLLKMNERIRVNNLEISDEEIYRYALIIDEIVSNNPGINPTYFDILTCIGFMHFADSNTDIAVIETGLGGRLDSTNVIQPLLSVITEISLDHTSVLGDTIELIAAEKAGIIKNHCDLVSACTSDKAMEVISDAALSKECSHYALYRDYGFINTESFPDGYRFDYESFNPDFIINDIFIPLRPEHQIQNASSAIAALMLLQKQGFSRITPELIRETFQTIKLPGRFEILRRTPLVIFDAAHNYNSLYNLLQSIEKNYSTYNLRVIVSIMADKISPEVRKLLQIYRDRIVYFLFDDERIYHPYKNEFNLVISDLSSLKEIIDSGENYLNLFTGTFRLYKYILDILSNY